MDNKKIMVALAFLAMVNNGYSAFECSTGLGGGCKTPPDAVNKCLKTNYANFYNAIRQDYLAGKNPQIPLIAPNIASYGTIVFPNKDPECLKIVSGKPFGDLALPADKAAHDKAAVSLQQQAVAAQQQAQQQALAQQQLAAQQQAQQDLVSACTEKCYSTENAFNECLAKKYPAVYADIKTKFSTGADLSVQADFSDFYTAVGQSEKAQECLNQMNKLTKLVPFYGEHAEGTQEYKVDNKDLGSVFSGVFTDEEKQQRQAVKKDVVVAALKAKDAELATRPEKVRIGCLAKTQTAVGAYTRCLAARNPDVFNLLKKSFVNGSKLEVQLKVVPAKFDTEKEFNPSFNPADAQNPYGKDYYGNKLTVLVDGRSEFPAVYEDESMKVYKSPEERAVVYLASAYDEAVKLMDPRNFSLYIKILDNDPKIAEDLADGSLTADQVAQIQMQFNGMFTPQEIAQRAQARGGVAPAVAVPAVAPAAVGVAAAKLQPAVPAGMAARG